MEIRHNEVAVCPLFGGELALRDGFAAFTRVRWPTGTAKAAAKEWGLSLDEAKGLVAGRASQATIDKVLKHPRGGWAVAFPVLGAVIGKTADDFLLEQRQRHVEAARRSGALVRDLRAGLSLLGFGAPRLGAERRSFDSADRGGGSASSDPPPARRA